MINGSATSVHVKHNGVVLQEGEVSGHEPEDPPSGNMTWSFSDDVELDLGDTLDFAVSGDALHQVGLTCNISMAPPQRLYVIVATLDGTANAKSIAANGVLEAVGSGSASYTNTHASIGALDAGSKFFTGDIAEIMIFDHLLDDDKVALLDHYFSQKYAIAFPYCGGAGTVYLSADANQDCYVDLMDFGLLAGQWLECTDPADAQCQ